MKKKPLPLPHVYDLIEPGPVALLTTMTGKQANVMAMSWHMMVDFEPPTLACVISNRNHMFGILKKTKECVVNIPTVELARRVVACGNISGLNLDKFESFGLTPRAAALVHAPLIDECYANLECQVTDTTLVEQYNIFIMVVVKAWIDLSKKNPRTIHHRGKGVFVVDGRTIKLPSGAR
jgi:flavin reductase (DIM6/NTAB) family NADH-FMN oxidoreductase RutF